MTPPTPNTNWAIIGPGRIAGRFAETLAATNVGTLTRVTGRSPERTAAFCAGYTARPADTLDDILADPEVHAVYVATPHSEHAAAVEPALRAGKAVLCEKPMTTTPDATRHLVNVARETNGILVEAWMYRTHPQLDMIAELIRLDTIGRVTEIRAAFGFEADVVPEGRLFNPALGGGAILDIGGYPASFSTHVAAIVAADGHRTSDTPRFIQPEVTDITGQFADTGVDATAEATLRFPGNLTARVSCSIARDDGRAVVIEGTRGRITVESPYLPGGRDGNDPARLLVDTPERLHYVTTESIAGCFAMEALEVTRLINTKQTRPRAPMVDHDESVAIADMLHAWRNGIPNAT